MIGSVQGQVGLGFEQPGLVEDVPNAAELDYVIFKGHFQPKQFHGPIKW